METNVNYIQNMARFGRSCSLYDHPPACRGVFFNLVLSKLYKIWPGLGEAAVCTIILLAGEFFLI